MFINDFEDWGQLLNLEKTYIRLIQAKLTHISYIGTWFKVHFIRDFVLTRVQFIQVLLYLLNVENVTYNGFPGRKVGGSASR